MESVKTEERREPQTENQEFQTVPEIPAPPWDMYTVFVAIMSAYLLLPLMMANLLEIFNPLLQPSYRILIEQAWTLVSWGGIFAFLQWRYKQCKTPIAVYLGLGRSMPKRYYLWEAFKLLLAMLALMLLLAILTQSLGSKPETPYTRFSSAELRVIAMFAIVSAPLLEEVVFRGFVQATFHKMVSPWRAVIFTCLFFLLLHPLYFNNPIALIYVTMLGLLLGYWRERTQSIIPGIMGHMFNNVLASLLMTQGMG